tara:strand:+ start:2406 stop:3419 length:1014 start_codon:yes stop_codon:yes gene_type:complete
MSRLLNIDEETLIDFSNSFKSLKSHSEIIVCSHIRPDGDSIGSQIALVRTLRQLGIPASMLLTPEIPEHLLEFVGDTPIAKITENPSPVIILDCSDCERVFCYAPKLKNREILLNIDHHETNSRFGKKQFLKPEACSTSHLLAEVFNRLKIEIDPTSANALYLGIYTDSGQFKYSRTNSSVFDTCSWLCKKGVNPEKIALSILNRNTLSHYRIQTQFLETIRLELDERVAIGILDLLHLPPDTNPFPANRECAELLQRLSGVVLSVYIEKVKNNLLKFSLRSNDHRYPIHEIALSYGGGGHPQAAGGTATLSEDEFIAEVVEKLALILEKNHAEPKK